MVETPLMKQYIEMKAVHPDANIIFGAAFDDELQDEMRVTVIATGLTEDYKNPKKGIIGPTPKDGSTDWRSLSQPADDEDDLLDGISALFDRKPRE